MTPRWVGCARGNYRTGRSGQVPEAIVIHIMEGSLAGTRSHFWNAASQVSAHYGVGKSGEIHQYVREADTAFHAGRLVRPSWSGLKRDTSGAYVNPNLYTIGIEHEGFATDPWPQPQTHASAELLADLARRWGIPLDIQHVALHREIRADKSCPGHMLDLAALLQAAGGLRGTPVAAPPPGHTVTARVNLRVRQGRPNTLAPVVRVLAAGTRQPVAGFTPDGERVNGNAFWYHDASGDFFWAGGTDRPIPTMR